MGQIFSGQSPKASQFAMQLCRYACTDTTSTIGIGATNLAVGWDTAISTTPYVTVSGTGNTKFTINRTGTWHLSFSRKYTFTSPPTTGDLFIVLAVNGVWSCGKTDQVPLDTTLNVGRIRPLSVNDVITTVVINTTDHTAVTTCNFAEQFTLSLLYMQGL